MAPKKKTAVDFYNDSLMGLVDLRMVWPQARAQSFADWPFAEEDSPCRPQKMADAGFYFVGSAEEPDLVRCFYCRRELGGWEPDDDPWSEHARRPCPYIKLSKVPDKLTMADMYKLEDERLAHIFRTQCEAKLESLQSAAQTTRDKIMDLPNAANARAKRKRK